MNDERIIKYITNEMSVEEIKNFDAELNKSPELRSELEKYRKVDLQILASKKLKLTQEYLDSIVPEFRNRVIVPESSVLQKNLGYAFGLMLLFILAVFGLKNFFIVETEVTELHEFTQSLDENQKFELLEKLYDHSVDNDLVLENIEGNVLADFLSPELQINNEIAEAYNISYSELIVGLTQNEVDRIYTEILNKNF